MGALGVAPCGMEQADVTLTNTFSLGSWVPPCVVCRVQQAKGAGADLGGCRLLSAHLPGLSPPWQDMKGVVRPVPGWSCPTGKAAFDARHMTSAKTSFPINH